MSRLDESHAGAEVPITWGEPDGGSRKSQVERHVQTTIRATVCGIDGKALAAEVRERVRQEVDRLVASGAPRPGSRQILVGDDPASGVYVANKPRAVRAATKELTAPAPATVSLITRPRR